jgi:hypothetical protein
MATQHAIALTVATESYPLKEPFNITGHRMTTSDVVLVTLQRGPHVGRGEAAGVFYLDKNDPPSMIEQIEAVRPHIEAGIERHALQDLLTGRCAQRARLCSVGSRSQTDRHSGVAASRPGTAAAAAHDLHGERQYAGEDGGGRPSLHWR